MSTGKNLEAINALLDAAKDKTGSDYKTAKLLGVTPAKVCDWRTDRQNAQPEDHALVAAIAGLDPEEALVRAVIAKHADKPKGERLLSALGNVLRRTGEAVTLGFFGSAVLGMAPKTAEAATSMAHQSASLDPWGLLAALATMCIMSNRRRREAEARPGLVAEQPSDKRFPVRGQQRTDKSFRFSSRRQ